MEQLTPSQLSKKIQLESVGGHFVPPSEYKKQRISKTSKGQKKVMNSSGQQVYRHQGDNVFKKNEWAKPVYRQLAPESQELVHMILDPEVCMNPVRWPNTLGPSAVFKTKNVLDAAFDTSGRSLVIVSPSITGALFATSGSAVASTDFTRLDVTASFIDDVLISQSTASWDAGTTNYWTAPIFLNGSNRAVLPGPSTEVTGTVATFPIGDGDFIYPISIHTPTSAELGIKCIGLFSVGSIALELIAYNSSMAFISSTVAYASGDGYLLMNNLFFASDVAYFSLRFKTLIPFVGSMQITIGQTGATHIASFSIPNHYQNCFVYDLSNGSTIEDNAWQYFVLAQSLLLTYEGSTLENSGQLAIARVAGDSIIGLSNNKDIQYNSYYQAISDLPINNYNGRTSKGGYSWYLGDDEESYFYRSIGDESYTRKSYIMASFTTSDSSSTPVRIMVNSVVQFTTDNTAFEQRPSCYIGSDMEHIRFLLSNIRASYENPTHREQLTKFLKDVGVKLLNVLKNPATYTTAAQLATLLL